MQDTVEATIPGRERQLLEKYRKRTQLEPFGWSQHEAIYKELLQQVARFAETEKESADEFEERAQDALALLDDIRRATNKKLGWDEDLNKPEEEQRKEYYKQARTVWFHGDPNQAFNGGLKARAYLEVDTEDLAGSVAKYLRRPSLQSNLLEWIFIDAFIFHEIVQFGEAVKQQMPGKRDFLGMHSAYFEHNGDLQKMTIHKLKRRLVKLALIWLVLPVGAAAYLIQQGSYLVAILLGAAWATAIILDALARTIFRYAFPRKKKAWESSVQLWHEMQDIYYFLEGPVINPTLVRDKVLAVTEKGARFRPALYALLDLIAKRDPSVFVPQADD